MNRDILSKIETEQMISRKELETLLTTTDQEMIEELYRRARKTAGKYYGKEIYLRGLIEFTNYCKNNCYYCGIRCGNEKVQRYRLTMDQILSCCESGWELGFRTFVLQGGEDPYYTDERICTITEEIKKRYPDCAVTLSIGEKERESYQAYFDAGADRYLLRHETADEAHYRRLHPSQMSLAHRKECLRELKEIGYQTGCGFMVGSPGQTLDTIYEDLVFIKELQSGDGGNRTVYSPSGYPFCRRKGRNAGRYLTASGNHPVDSSDGTVAIHHGTWNDSSDGKRKGYSGRSQCGDAKSVTGSGAGQIHTVRQ